MPSQEDFYAVRKHIATRGAYYCVAMLAATIFAAFYGMDILAHIVATLTGAAIVWTQSCRKHAALLVAMKPPRACATFATRAALALFLIGMWAWSFQYGCVTQSYAIGALMTLFTVPLLIIYAAWWATGVPLETANREG
ncbi:MAG: hypothetical protein ABIG71_00735 [Candidatus Uhrbacteria bacterium]